MIKQEKKYLEKIVIFIILILILILIANTLYIELVLSKKTFFKKEIFYREYISNLSEKSFDYVFLGDSHTFHAINPDFINNSYNYGTGAENYVKTYYKLRKMIEKEDVKIKTIVLELDLHTFSTRLTDDSNLFSEIELYNQFVSLKEINEVLDEESILSLWLKSNFPLFGKGKEFGVLIIPLEFNEIYPNGWLKNKGNFSQIDKEANALNNYNSLFVNQERISNVSFEYFIKTLKLAKNNNISIIFIKYPHSKEFDEVITKNNISKEDYYDYIFSNVNKTIDNYEILNYYYLFEDKDYLFGDSEHVNYVGSEILSKKIYYDLKRL